MVVLGLLYRIVFWLYTSVSDEHTVFIFGNGVRKIRKWMVCVGLAGGSDKALVIHNHRMRMEDGTELRPIEKCCFWDTKGQGWTRREEKSLLLLRTQKLQQVQEVLFLEIIFFCSFGH